MPLGSQVVLHGFSLQDLTARNQLLGANSGATRTGQIHRCSNAAGPLPMTTASYSFMRQSRCIDKVFQSSLGDSSGLICSTVSPF